MKFINFDYFKPFNEIQKFSIRFEVQTIQSMLMTLFHFCKNRFGLIHENSSGFYSLHRRKSLHSSERVV